MAQSLHSIGLRGKESIKIKEKKVVVKPVVKSRDFKALLTGRRAAFFKDLADEYSLESESHIPLQLELFHRHYLPY